MLWLMSILAHFHSSSGSRCHPTPNKPTSYLNARRQPSNIGQCHDFAPILDRCSSAENDTVKWKQPATNTPCTAAGEAHRSCIGSRRSMDPHADDPHADVLRRSVFSMQIADISAIGVVRSRLLPNTVYIRRHAIRPDIPPRRYSCILTVQHC